jgi:hypothetical protein
VGVGYIIIKAPTITVKYTALNYHSKVSLMLNQGIVFGEGYLDRTPNQDLEKDRECVAVWIMEGPTREIMWPFKQLYHEGILYCLLVVEDGVQ